MAVKERHKRKKQRILPLRKKNEYGETIGLSCESKGFLRGDKEKSDRSEKKE